MTLLIRSENGDEAIETIVHDDLRALAQREWDDGYARGVRLARFLETVIGPLDDSRVLDLGCAAGGIALAFAERAGCVIGMDVAPREVSRALGRAGGSGIPAPPSYLAASGLALPFRDASFDLVLLNGVLEYMGRARADVTPREAQRACLEEVARVLAPGGRVVVAIENRWYPPFLLRSPHQGVAGALLLPQRVAFALGRHRRSGRIWEALHGYGALCRLLSDGGFSAANGFLPVYGYQFPKAMVPVDDRRALWRLSRRAARAEYGAPEALSSGGRWGPLWFRTLALLGWQRLLAPCFLVIASRREPVAMSMDGPGPSPVRRSTWIA